MLTQYIRSEEAIVLTPVPGDTRMYKKRSKRVWLGSSSVVSWHTELHVLGWCLEGNATQLDFGIVHLWLSQRGVIFIAISQARHFGWEE
jgi:hypothetical protein